MTGPAAVVQHPSVRLLVAEDEWLIVEHLARTLAGSRYEIAAKAATVTAALGLLSSIGFDAAILDGNLSGEHTGSVATQLQAVGIPFLLLTAYAPELYVDRWGNAPMLQKPFSKKMLVAALDQLIEAASSRRYGEP